MNSRKSSNVKNDGERLYEFTQKMFKLLTDVGTERKKSKEDWNKEVITQKQHHRNITKLYVKTILGMEHILRWELADIITVGLTSIFEDKKGKSLLFDELTLQKGKQLVDDFKPAVEHVKKVNKELKTSNDNLATHKPFAGLDKKLATQ